MKIIGKKGEKFLRDCYVDKVYEYLSQREDILKNLTKEDAEKIAYLLDTGKAIHIYFWSTVSKYFGEDYYWKLKEKYTKSLET